MVRDRLVRGARQAPVQVRAVVVHGVEAVVEHEEVHPARGEVARVVPARRRGAVHVLHVVGEHQSPDRARGGNAERARIDDGARARPMQTQGHGERDEVPAVDQDVLGDQPRPGTHAAPPHAPQIRGDERRLPSRRVEEVRERPPRRVALRVPPGRGDIALAVHVAMVVLVVGRDPSEDRISIEERYRRRVEGIRTSIREHRDVVVVVRQHARGVREVHRDR